MEKVLFCDCCDKLIQSFDEFGQPVWKKGAFQRGKLKSGKIATWCSKECYKEGSLLLTSNK